MHRHAVRERTSNRGFVLMVVCAVVGILLLSAATLARLAAHNLATQRQRLFDKQAVYAAEQGLQAGLMAVRVNAAWAGSGSASQALPGVPGLNYQVQATNNASGSSNLLASDGTVVPPGCIYLRSRGSASAGVQRVVTGLLKSTPGSLFTAALWGYSKGAVLGSTVVDAFNGASGAYSPGTRVAVGAPVGTNGTSNGVLSLSGSSQVDGNLYIGPGGNPATAVSGASSATGTVLARTTPLPVVNPVVPGTGSTAPPVSYTDIDSNTYTLPPGTYGDLSLGNGTVLTLTPGTYVFAANAASQSTGSVSLSASSQIVVAGNGPVIIYFQGTWSQSGGSQVNPLGLASSFAVVGTSSASSVSLQGSSQATMALYAPTATVSMGGSSVVTGALVANSFALQGTSTVHYDTSLAYMSAYGGGTTTWSLAGVHRW